MMVRSFGATLIIRWLMLRTDINDVTGWNTMKSMERDETWSESLNWVYTFYQHTVCTLRLRCYGRYEMLLKCACPLRVNGCVINRRRRVGVRVWWSGKGLNSIALLVRKLTTLSTLATAAMNFGYFSSSWVCLRCLPKCLERSRWASCQLKIL